MTYNRFLAVTLVVLLSFALLTACGENNTDGNHTSDTPSTVVTTTTASPIDIPEDSVCFRVVSADGEPIAGANMSCTMPPDENGDAATITELMGETDENGRLLWKCCESGEREFYADLDDTIIGSWKLDITEDILGTEIVLQLQ